MTITIQKLNPDLLEDFLYYFDHLAFADHPDWSGCYCVEPHLCKHVESELPKGASSIFRTTAVNFVQSGKLQGYLAYVDGKVSGW